MRRILRILALVPAAAALLLPAAPLFSQSEAGGVAGIFSYGAGLRALGMGGAFTAVTGDPSTVYWNPGAMALNQYREVSVFGTRSIADTYYAAAFYTHPTLRLGTVGVGGMGVYTGGIESYDENGSPITTSKDSYLHYQAMLSYGYSFDFGLAVGTTVKVEQMRITDYKGTGTSFDVGAYYQPPPLPWLTAGLVVHNVYGTGIRLVDEYEAPTRIYQAGVAGTFPLGGSRLILSMDHRVYTDNYNPPPRQLIHEMAVGAELAIGDSFALRAGYGYFTLDGAFQNLPAGLAVGAGFRQWGVGIDYAVNFEDTDWQGPVEMLMRLGLSYRFGQSLDERKAEEAQRIKRQVDEGIKEATRQYEQQLDQLAEQYDREREQLEQQFEQRYQDRLQDLDAQIQDERQEILADVSAQFEAEKQQALDELAEEFEQQRAELELALVRQQNVYENRIGQLQNQFEQERQNIRQEAVADEAFKSERYARGLQLYSDGQYEEALAEFETVARYDDEYLNVQEYINRSEAQLRDVSSYSPEIMQLYYNGIDLFVQQEYRQAIAEWQKILDLDPYNKLAIRNIKEARDRLRRLQEMGIDE